MNHHEMTAAQSYALVKDELLEPHWSRTARQVLERRYLRKDEAGEIVETPGELLWRVAWAAAGAERNYPESPYFDNVLGLAVSFYDLMATKRFLPNSPTLMNAGTDMGQLAACFVLPVDDSMEGIFDAVKHAAMVHKTGGGTGFSFSRLRHKGAAVRSTSGVASGPVSFAKVFDIATEQVKQGGKRRGANMGVLRCDHPDVVEFIQCKDEPGVLENFNLSVGVTDEFMQALESGHTYPLRDPRSGELVTTQSAQEVWDLLVGSAWKRGDPGVLFLDTINRANPTPWLGQIEATNPCGELPLLPYEACNLGSINLSAYWAGLDVHWVRLSEDVDLCVRFLDNIIDISRYPLPEVTEMVRATRKIGLGVMGWADMLFQAVTPYDSPAAVTLARAVMARISSQADAASSGLAHERGPYPSGEDAPLFLPGVDVQRRNATLTTIAPTGTLSILAGCSSGIEPLFALVMERRIMDNDVFLEAHQGFRDALLKCGIDPEPLCRELAGGELLRDMPDMPRDLLETYVTAMDIEPEWHLKMQAAFQEHVDSAVSKTVNMPHFCTREHVDEIYRMAYALGCKGVTVFRDGCRGLTGQVLSTPVREPSLREPSPRTDRDIRDRPDELAGITRRMKTGQGTLYLTVNELGGRPFEVFATIGKSGREVMASAESVGRLVSLALRSGISVQEVVRQLQGIGGEHPVFREKGLILSIPDAVAQMLRRWCPPAGAVREPPGMVNGLCPDCGAELVFEEGCHACKACGWTKCGG